MVSVTDSSQWCEFKRNCKNESNSDKIEKQKIWQNGFGTLEGLRNPE
jgi:hypothetical protein